MSESMTLPKGFTCGDCRMFSKCHTFIGVVETTNECDFFPVKFSLSLDKYRKMSDELNAARNLIEQYQKQIAEARRVSVSAKCGNCDDYKNGCVHWPDEDIPEAWCPAWKPKVLEVED